MLGFIDFSKSNFSVLFFETVIRYLGGLLSGYDLSNNKILLKKAIQLADNLMFAFNSPSGFPYSEVNFKTKKGEGEELILAEIGTVQLEFSRLSEITGNLTYRNSAYKVYNKLNK